MCSGANNLHLLKMVVALAFLGLTRALTIDNHLSVIKNDCYERLAIEQRLNPKDVYKIVNPVKSLQDCQMSCTREEEVCRSFSYGVGVKGNITCELGLNVIKETADLKPIGTKTDTEFDLYIKKLGCKMVIDKNEPSISNHPVIENSPELEHVNENLYVKPDSIVPNTQSYGKPQSNRPGRPDRPNDIPRPIQSPVFTGEYHVQTLVSVRPQNENIPLYVSQESNKPSNNDDRPNELVYGRPDEKPPSYNNDRPSNTYGRPSSADYNNPNDFSYGKPNNDNKPINRPSSNSYDTSLSRPSDSYERPQNRPTNRPSDSSYDRPQSSPLYGRPINNRPSDVSYGRPPLSDDDRPLYGGSNNRPPVYDRPGYDRPENEPPSYGKKPGKDPLLDKPSAKPSMDDKRPPYDRPPMNEPPDYNPDPPSYGRPPPLYEYDERPHNRPPVYDRPYQTPTKRPLYFYDERPMRPNDYGSGGPYGPRPDRPYGMGGVSNNLQDIPRPPYNYDDRDRPPFRPLYLNSPYDEPRPLFRPERPQRPNFGYIENDPIRPVRPERPNYDNRPINDDRPSYSDKPFDTNNPNYGNYDRPLLEESGYDSRTRPSRPNKVNPPQSDNSKIDYASKPRPIYDEPPKKPYGSTYNKPGSQDSGYDRPASSSTQKTTYIEILQTATQSPGYNNPTPNYDKPNEKPQDSNNPNSQESYSKQPIKPSKESYGGGGVTNKIPDTSYQKEPHTKPIITQTTGPGGQTITSIITPLNDADGVCFRRALAGKRVARRFVRRALACERIEDCQQECADEKRFVCEGFNYRLDPTGRSKGECELLDVPITHLDIGRDLYPDPDYDYYERDRNSAPDCKRRPSFDGGYGGGSGFGHGHIGGYGNGYDNVGHNFGYHQQDYGDSYNRRHDHYYNDRRFGGRRPPPSYDYGERPPSFDGYYEDRYSPYPDRQGDFYYQHSHHSQHEHENSHNYHFKYHFDKNDHHQPHDSGHHYHGTPYLPNNRHRPYHPPEQYDYKSYEPYLPPNRRYDDRDKYYSEREKDRNYWGIDKYGGGWGSYGGSHGSFGSDQSWHYKNQNRHDYDYYHRKNYYLPPKRVIHHDDWGQYGGSYGTGGNYHDNNYSGFNYWGFKRKHDGHHDNDYYYEHSVPNHHLGTYLPINYDDSRRSYNGYNRNSYNNKDIVHHNAITPSYIGSNPTKFSWEEQNTYNFMRDGKSMDKGISLHSNGYFAECSLRSATGFRLHKGIIKKFVAVPNIFECEMLCFKEKDFKCNSYAYRYTISSNAPTDNCYLSNKNYKELDYYTDFEPDRDFDIYTMNNPTKCGQPTIVYKDSSECFWRVRSGSRLTQKIVREALNVKTVVECQVECLKSTRFICRAFSFRYGSGVIGGLPDNCQLTDWPYHELDPNVHLVSEPGFELYERGSFGHGCEPNHFKIQYRHKDQRMQADQLCYVGFGSPARLLPQATRKALTVGTELDCKTECSRYRQGTLFQCMSFSFRTSGPKGEINCYLSDILQRDLLANVDYVDDPDSWLFAWDNYNPECVALANKPLHGSNNVPNKGHPVIENRLGKFLDQIDDLDTWRIYSVRGWPCKRGSFCKENKEAGFWYCELEGGNKNNWDYCCRPDHQCGFSEEYPYQWCFVGPAKTQWRKCSDRYFPYVDNNSVDRNDHVHYEEYPPQQHKNPWTHHRDDSYLPHLKPNVPHYRPGGRPDRPPAPPTQHPPRPSLDEYEMQFDDHFLDPPRPGGFGQPRRWPVSYLHKEMPPNETTLASSKFEQMTLSYTSDPKFDAIRNLIDIIKSNDLKNIQYQITNASNKADDILFVKIPLPSNFTHDVKNQSRSDDLSKLEMIDLESTTNETRGQNRIDRSSRFNNASSSLPQNTFGDAGVRNVPVYRRAFITKTNVTTHGRKTKFN